MTSILNPAAHERAQVVVRNTRIALDLGAVGFPELADDFVLSHPRTLGFNAQRVKGSSRAHMHNGYPQNTGMEKGSQKKPLRQIVAENLDRLMEAHGIPDNNSAAGRKTKVIHSTIRRIRNQEISTTIDTLEQIATGFGVQTWELLVDGDAARAVAWQRLMRGGSSSEPGEAPNKDKPGPGARPKKAARDEPAPPNIL
jgi:hypothetical protein